MVHHYDLGRDPVNMGGRHSKRKNDRNVDDDDRELRESVSCGRWEDVFWLLRSWKNNERRLSAACRAFAVEQACQHADDDCCEEIVAECPDLLSDALLAVVVKRDLWRTVSIFLQLVHAHENRHTVRWAVEEVCKRADDDTCTDIASSSPQHVADMVLTETVKQGRWETASELFKCANLKFSNKDTVRRAMEEICKRLTDDECRAIVRYCADDQNDIFLTVAVRQGLWGTVEMLILFVRCNEDTVRWLVEEVVKRADDDTCVRFASSLPEYTAADMVLTETVRQGRWKTANKLLTSRWAEFRNGDTVRWAVEETFNRAPDKECADIIRQRYFAYDQIDTLLSVAVRRGLWETVCWLLGCFGFHADRETVSWVVEEACNRAPDKLCADITRHLADDQISTLLTVALRRDLKRTLRSLCQLISARRISNTRDSLRLAVEEACKQDDETQCLDIVSLCADAQPDVLLTEAARRGLWKTVRVLLVWTTGNRDTGWAQCRAVEEACKRADDETFSTIASCVAYSKYEPTSYFEPDFIRSMARQWDNVLRVFTRVAPEHRGLLMGLLKKRGLDHIATDIIVDTCKELGVSERTEDKLCVWARLYVHTLSAHSADHTDVSGTALTLREYLDSVTELHDKVVTQIVSVMAKRNDRFTLKIQDKVWHGMRSVLQHTSARDTDVCVHFVKWCVQRRGRTTSLCQLSLPLVASQTVNLALQRLARTSMWEETRRWHLQFLVEEKLWDIVKEVADHSVYDDQRAWALAQACQDKQWDVVVLLADHGLTEKRRYRLYRQVAKYADWDIVRLLFERAVDMQRVSEELMAGNPCRERPPGKIDRNDIERRRLRGENVSKLEAWYRERSERVARLTLEHNQRCTQVERLEKRQARATRDFMSLLAARKWYAVLSQLRQDDVSEERIELTLQHAIQSEAWSVVAQLIRLGIDAAQRDWLFSETIRRRQWGVARMLLEHTVSEEWSQSEYSGSEEWSQSEQGVSEEQSQSEHGVSQAWSQSEQGVSVERSQSEHGVSEEQSQSEQGVSEEWSRSQQGVSVVWSQSEQGVSVKRSQSEHAVSEEQSQSEDARVSEEWSQSEHGVSVEVSRAVVQELMQKEQWLLLARVMEVSLNDTDRRRVMQVALDKKEGSMVAHGISVMEGRVSVRERQAMYKQALGQETWQTVKRLVEEKDVSGLEQRDQALVAAVDRHRWDVVEHCVLQGADINSQDDEGDTMLHKKAKKEEWDSVDGLAWSGSNPNLLNGRGYSAFHGAINHTFAKRDPALWSLGFRHRDTHTSFHAIETLVQFHGNLNQPDPKGNTPLYRLIGCDYKDTYYAGRILDCALWWGSDVSQRVNCWGRTALHVVCQAGRPAGTPCSISPPGELTHWPSLMTEGRC